MNSRGGTSQSGHYLTYIDPATSELTVLAVFGIPFLVLHYRIHRKPGR